MYSVKMAILNLDKASEAEFSEAAMAFVDNLSKVEYLQLDVPTKQIEGTRGDIPLWAGIVMTAISTGAFMAVYTMAKDMFTIYTNAEVELEFEDGSSMALKHLTRKEAEAILKEHLERKMTNQEAKTESTEAESNQTQS